MDTIEFIFDLITIMNNKIYFHDYENFEKFLESPYDTEYYRYDTFKSTIRYDYHPKNNILFYLAHKKYDLIGKIVDYGTLNKIDINRIMLYRTGITIRKINILMFSCLYSNKLSSNMIVKMILECPNIDVNSQNENGWSALMYASNYSNSNSSEKTVKMLLEHPKINVNLQNEEGLSALMLISRSLNNSTEGTVKMLLDHPDIDINLQTKDGQTALSLLSYNSKNSEKIERLIKLFLKHKIKNNMFYLYEIVKSSSIKKYNIEVKKYMVHQRYNLINHRRSYRKHILNKGY
jgi:phage pi2 protein 07